VWPWRFRPTNPRGIRPLSDSSNNGNGSNAHNQRESRYSSSKLNGWPSRHRFQSEPSSCVRHVRRYRCSFLLYPATRWQVHSGPSQASNNRQAASRIVYHRIERLRFRHRSRADHSTGFHFGDTKEKARTKPGPFTTACVAYGSDSIGTISTDSRGSGKRQRRSLPSCSAGSSDSAIFSISFSERLDSITTFTSSVYQVSRFPSV